MEMQITTKPRRIKPAHLMCGQPIWGLAGVLSCSYLAYLSWGHVRQGDFDWAHDAWSIVTYAVWVLLMLGLLTETRCWRERAFFALVLANFSMGLALVIWRMISCPAANGIICSICKPRATEAPSGTSSAIASGMERSFDIIGRSVSNRWVKRR